jgi:putative ABC transport system substrate-binding protein
MKQFAGDQANMIFAIGTPPLQAALKEIWETMPVVFAHYSNPWGPVLGHRLAVSASTDPM